MKNIIERGASWTLEETKLLLSLWGQDLVQRQATNAKRTKEVYEKISEKFAQHGWDRTSDQVRTRVFNMIAEYRRILKDPRPERVKKCIFFEALHKIYQAKDLDDVKSALDNYQPDDLPYSPCSNSDKDTLSDSDVEADISAYQANVINNTPTLNNINVVLPNSNNNNASSKDPNSHSNSSPASTGPSSNKRHRSESSEGPNPPLATLSATTSSDVKPSSSSASSSSSTTAALAANTNLAANSNTLTATGSSHQRHQSLLLSNQNPTSSSTSQQSTPIQNNKKTATATLNSNTTSFINLNTTKLPIIRTNQLIGHPNNSSSNNEPINGTRLPTTAITSHQLYQAPVSTFDVTSSALLIDRMFAHLARESENMREWIALEKERVALDRARRQQENEREARRDKNIEHFITKMNEQWFNFVSSLDPQLAARLPQRPQLNLNSNLSTSDAATSAEQSKTDTSS